MCLHQSLTNTAVSMEVSAETNQIGGLEWVSHRDKPSVDAFFESHYERTLLINGVQVRSIAHDICTSILFTGGVSGESADWATRIAGNRPFVGDSPFGSGRTQFCWRPGGHGGADWILESTRGCVESQYFQRSNDVVPTLSTPSQDVLDRYIQQRVHAKASQAHYGADLRLSTA